LRARLVALPRPARAILSLGAITACKILIFLLLFEADHDGPYVGDSARPYFLPAANSILRAGTFSVGPDPTSASKVAPGYPTFLALVQWISPGWHLPLVVCLQMVFDLGVAALLLLIGMRETSLEAGWLAAVLWLVFPPPAVAISTWIAS
jgi:hypothetical protein